MGLVVDAGDPAGVDVQLHATHDTGVLQDPTQCAHREGVAADVDLGAGGGDAEGGAVDVGGGADGGAPLCLPAGGARRVDLAAVDEHHQVLAHAGHVRRHPDFVVPRADGRGAVGVQYETGRVVLQRERGAAFAVVT